MMKCVLKRTKFPCHDQGHLFAMEVSSGEEYYIASDNTGTPLAVFSSNGQMIKQVMHAVYLDLSLFPVHSCQENSKMCWDDSQLQAESSAPRGAFPFMKHHHMSQRRFR